MDGNLGSYFIEKTGRFSSTFFLTLNKAIFLGIFFALVIAESIKLSGYCLARSRSFYSFNLRSGLFWFVQMRIILNAREYGIALDVVFGWQLDGSRYWFLCVFFL